MPEKKICPMLSEITTHKNKYGGKVSELCEEPCREEKCAWWDEHNEQCSVKSIANLAGPNIVQFDGKLSEEEFEKIRKKFEQKYSGPGVDNS